MSIWGASWPSIHLLSERGYYGGDGACWEVATILLMYVDESASESYVALAGVILDAVGWQRTRQRVDALKRKYFPGRNPDTKEAELRSYNIRNRLELYSTLTDEKYSSLLCDLNRMIEKLPFTLVAAAIDTNKAKAFYPHLGDAYELAYTFLLERFQMHVQESGSRGIVVCDSRSKVQDHGLSQRHLELLNGMSKISKVNFRSIVGGLTFAQSHLDPGLQVADLCAYAVLRHVGGRPYAPWAIVKQKLRRDARGQYRGIGLKIFPDDQTKTSGQA